MDIGVVLQTTPPSARVVDLAKKADMYGFSHVWTFDSHILWQEPYVIYSQIAPLPAFNVRGALLIVVSRT